MLDRILAAGVQPALWTFNRIDQFRGQSVNYPPDGSPQTQLEKLRQHGTMIRSLYVNGWTAIGYDNVQALLQHKQLTTDIASNRFANLVIRSAAGRPDVPFLDYPSMQQSDPPAHTRLRKLTAAGFTHKYVQTLEPVIERLVEECLDNIPGPDFDFMAHLARPLPAIVIAEMLGVPVEERHLFEQWSAEILGISQVLRPNAIKTAVEADIALRDYLAAQVRLKRDQPGDDLLSRLLTAEAEGDALTLDELYSTCILLLMAGHETTTRLLGNCLYRLLTHPEAMADVRRDDTLLTQAIEESLRLDPPVMITTRFVKSSFDWQHVHLKAGRVILLSILGANHDPAVNAAPARFDIHRESIRHLSFGYGMHLCLGISLARLEARVAMKQLLARYPGLQLADSQPDWEYSPFFRGMNTLNLVIQRG